MESKIANPAYRKINNQLKKGERKTATVKSHIAQQNLNATTQLDEFKIMLESKATLVEQIEAKQRTVDQLLKTRNPIPGKIKLAEMPPEQRINKLKTEKRLFYVQP